MDRSLIDWKWIILVFNMLMAISMTIGLWMIDISLSGMVLSAQFQAQIVAIGLFGERDLNIQYHYGLMVSIITFILTVSVNSMFAYWRLETLENNRQ